MPSAAEIRAGAAYVELYAESNRLVRGLKMGEKLLKDWGRRVSSMGKKTMAAGAATVTPILAAAKAFAAAGDQLDAMSKRTGIAVETLSALSHAAQINKTDLETVGAAIQKMNRRVGRMTAGQGSDTQVAAMKELGLSLDELSKMNPEQQFFALADAVANYGNQAEAAGLAQRAFGTQIDQLLPLFAGGSRDIRALMEKARELGYVMGEEDATAAAKLTDAMTRAKTALYMTFIRVGSAVAPMLTDWADRIGKVSAEWGGWIKQHGDVIVRLVKVGAVITGVGAGLTALGTVLWSTSVILGTTAAAVKGLTTALTFLAAHPGLIAVTAIAAAGYGLYKLTSHTADLRDEAMRLRDANDQLRASDQARLERLGELAEKHKLTNAEMNEAERLIGQLEDRYGDLGISVDRATGTLTGFASGMKQATNAMKEMAVTELEREIAELESNMAELEKTAHSAWRRMWTGGGGERAGVGSYTKEEWAQFRDYYGRYKATVDRLQRLKGGDQGALAGGAVGQPLAAPGGVGALPELGTASEAAKFEEEMLRHINDLKIQGIEDAHQREIARINAKYDLEAQRARELSADIEGVEAARYMALAQLQQEHDRTQREEAERFAADIQDQLARAEIEAIPGLDAVERRKRLLDLERADALEEAERLGVPTADINRLFDLREAAAASRDTSKGGIIQSASSTAMLKYLGGTFAGSGTPEEETAEATKKTAENTDKLVQALQLNKLVWVGSTA